MENKKFLYKILLLAYEDYCGLWEVFGEAQDILGQIYEDEIISYGRKGVSELINRGWIRLYWCKEPLSDEIVTPIDQNLYFEVLAMKKYWDEPEKNEISVRFLATEEGEKAYCENLLDMNFD